MPKNISISTNKEIAPINIRKKATEISSQSAGRSRADSPIYHPKLATGDAKQHDDDADEGGGEDDNDDDVDGGEDPDLSPQACNR